MEVTVKEGKYIYCIITTRVPKTFGPLGIGGRGDELYTVCLNDIAAVVSNSPIINYSISRENALAHEKAIEDIMEEHTVLPVRFCTIAEDEVKIRKILEKEYVGFKDLIKKLEGKKEQGLKAIFKEDVIYQYILEKYDDIRILKEKVVKLPPQKTYYHHIEIGKMVEQALETEKENYKDEIMGILRPMAEDVRINKVYGPRLIVNAAFLVNEDKEAEFDQRVNELAEKYGDKIIFKHIGRVPPFNFVNLVIEV